MTQHYLMSVKSITIQIETHQSDEDMCIVLDNLEEKFKQKLQFAARIGSEVICLFKILSDSPYI